MCGGEVGHEHKVPTTWCAKEWDRKGVVYKCDWYDGHRGPHEGFAKKG
jgi:hypothetical protein